MRLFHHLFSIYLDFFTWSINFLYISVPIGSNVFKIGLIIESKKLPTHISMVGPMLESLFGGNSNHLANEPWNQVYIDQTVRIPSGFIDCRGHDHFFKYIQDLMFSYTIYVPFIDVITIILWLDNLTPFFTLKVGRSWPKIIIPSSSLLFKLVVYPIYLRILFLKCWSYLVHVWCFCYNIYWLCIWSWGFERDV